MQTRNRVLSRNNLEDQRSITGETKGQGIDSPLLSPVVYFSMVRIRGERKSGK